MESLVCKRAYFNLYNIEHVNEKRSLDNESSIISFTCSPFLLFIANFPLPLEAFIDSSRICRWNSSLFHCVSIYFRFSQSLFFSGAICRLSTRFSSKVIQPICQLSLNHSNLATIPQRFLGFHFFFHYFRALDSVDD